MEHFGRSNQKERNACNYRPSNEVNSVVNPLWEELYKKSRKQVADGEYRKEQTRLKRIEIELFKSERKNWLLLTVEKVG